MGLVARIEVRNMQKVIRKFNFGGDEDEAGEMREELEDKIYGEGEKGKSVS